MTPTTKMSGNICIISFYVEVSGIIRRNRVKGGRPIETCLSPIKEFIINVCSGGRQENSSAIFPVNTPQYMPLAVAHSKELLLISSLNCSRVGIRHGFPHFACAVSSPDPLILFPRFLTLQ